MYPDEMLLEEADTYLKEERSGERRELVRTGRLDARLRQMVERCRRRAQELQEDGALTERQAWLNARREMVGRQPKGKTSRRSSSPRKPPLKNASGAPRVRVVVK